MMNNYRDQIERLMAEYSAVIDSDELEKWPELFTDACHYRVTTRSNYANGFAHGAIWANSKGMLLDRVSALREANVYEEHVYRHICDSVRILNEDKKLVQVQSNFLVVRTMHTGQMDVFATGMYVDEIQLNDNLALFKQRIVVCDSHVIDTLLALPL